MKADDTSEPAILLAAETSVKRHGLLKMTMSDVAAEARVSRQTVYRRFPRREDLLDAMSRRKLDQLNLAIAAQIENIEDPVERMVEAVVTSVFTVLDDPVSRELMHDDARMAMQRISTADYKAVARRRWKPIIDQARECDSLKDTVSDKQLIEWLSMLQVALISWVEVRKMTRSQLRSYVRNLALAGVLKD